MKPCVSSHARFAVLAIGLLFASIAAGASSEKVLHTFSFTDGAFPYNGVVLDAAGNLYGTTVTGGSANCTGYGCGVVFKLTPEAGGDWKESPIYGFTGGEDGSYPDSPLVFDGAGNLYGTAAAAGGLGNGTVFKLAPAAGGSWKFSVIHTFAGGNDGAEPIGPIVFDTAGNLYGTTFEGGSYNGGTAFELGPTASGEWKETLLHTFTGGLDGVNPFGLAMDAHGAIYGSGYCGGGAVGVVFSLTLTGNSWKETVLRHFYAGMEGGVPWSLVFDTSGNLYGTTVTGGNTRRCPGGCGVVFELAPNPAGPWKETVLHYFNGEDGLEAGGLIFGSRGNLYGWAGPSYRSGLIFSMSSDDDWAETPVLQFSGDGGYEPDGPIIENQAGHLFGTTVYGGNYDAGVVYEVTP